ncbi:MAG: PilZ domain-containing protein [Polyangiales bacterium]
MTTGVSDNQRRRALRVPMSWPVTFHHAQSNGLRGEIRDLSESGLFLAPRIEVDRAPRSGEEIAVVCFVGGEPFYLEGRVRWVGRNPRFETHGFGVAFLPTSAYVGEALAYALSTTDQMPVAGIVSPDRIPRVLRA